MACWERYPSRNGRKEYFGRVRRGQHTKRVNRACWERYPSRDGRKQYSSRVGREQYPGIGQRGNIISNLFSHVRRGHSPSQHRQKIKSSTHSATPAGYATSATICSSRSTGTEANRPAHRTPVSSTNTTKPRAGTNPGNGDPCCTPPPPPGPGVEPYY